MHLETRDGTRGRATVAHHSRETIRSLVVAVVAALVATLLTPLAPGSLGGPRAAWAVGNYSSTVAADSPVGYWRLGEGSGTTAADSSGNSGAGTYVGGTTLGASGAPVSDSDTAVSMDGSSGYVQVPSSSALNPSAHVTVEAWVNPSTGQFADQKAIVMKGYTSHSSPYYQYGLTMLDSSSAPKDVTFWATVGGGLRYVDMINSGWTYSSWNHIVGTYDGSALRLYVNGILQASTAASGALSGYSTVLDIGAYENLAKNSTYLYGGALDEVAVYGSALSQARINAHYLAATGNSPSAPVASGYDRHVRADGPSAYWRLHETTGSYATDESGYGNTAQYLGGYTQGAAGAIKDDTDSAVSLDGVSGYLEAPSSATLNAPTTGVTVEAWVKPASGSLTLQRALVDKAYTSHNSPYYQYGLFMYDDTPAPKNVTFWLTVAGAPRYVLANNTGYNYGVWNHIVGTYDGARMRMYVNGNLVADAAQTGTLSQYATVMDIGAYPNLAKNSTYVLPGDVDDVAIYDHALTRSRVVDHFVSSGRTVIPTGGAPSAAELAGGGSNNTHSCSAAGLHGNATQYPVDTESGNFWHTFEDVKITGRSCPLQISRTYNSQDASTNGPFGYGWRFNYGMSLSCSGTTATLTQENGSQVAFATTGSCSSGTWTAAAPRVLATLVHNTGGTWTLTRQSNYTYDFDSAGDLTTITDRNGYVTTLAYSSGKLSSITDPDGRSLSLGWTGSNITSVTDANISPSRTVNYSYDSAGELEDVTDMNGGVTHFSYDSSHRLLVMKNPTCQALGSGCPGVQNHYDSAGRIDWQKDQLNNQTSFTYSGTPGSAAGGSTTITDPSGNVTVESYQYSLLTSVTRGSGTSDAATWRFGYDPDTLVPTTTVDANGSTSTQTMDSHGNVLTSTDPLGNVTTNTYNSADQILTSQDPNGVTTTMTYDSHGNLATSSKPLSGTSCPCQVTTLNHADSSHPGDVTSMVDPDGKTWSYHYDAYGQRVQSKDPLGHVTATVLNAVGWPTSSFAPRAGCTWATAPPTGCSNTYKTTISYLDPATSVRNNFGAPIVVTDALVNATVTRYNDDGQRSSVTDSAGNNTTFSYDLTGRLTTTTRPDSSTLVTDYNPDGTVQQETDASGATRIAYTYDPLGRTSTTTVDPGSGTHLNQVTTLAYDGNGNVLSEQRPGGTCPAAGCTSYTYDADNRLTDVHYSDGVTPDVTGITYDNNGNRTAVTDGSGTSQWTWDQLNRLASYTNGDGKVVSYAYDARNLATTITYPGGHDLARTFDDTGRLSSVEDWLTSANISTFGYDADGNLTSETLPNGVVNSYTFDARGAMTAISDVNGSTTVFAANYTRGTSGRVSSDSSAPSGSDNFQYSELSQLCYEGSSSSAACASPPSGATPYAFDARGNVTNLAGAGQAFDSASQLCWSKPATGTAACASPPSGATTYGHDVSGNLTLRQPSSGAATCYSYDQANRLTGINTGTGSTCTSPTTTGTYAYDSDGLRESKVVSGVTTKFTWDGSSGAVPDLLQQKVGAAAATSLVYGPGGLPIEQIDSAGAPHFYHHDQIGSTRAVSSSSGSVESTKSFDPYGGIAASSGSVDPILTFAGQYADAESQLIYLRARYYDPSTAQFLTRDPLEAITGSPYAYTDGQPLDASDPSGLFCLIGHNSDGSCRGADFASDAGATWTGYVDSLLPTKWVRDQLGIDSGVECTDAYRAIMGLMWGNLPPNAKYGIIPWGPEIGPAEGGPKSSPNFKPPTNSPQLPPTEIPMGWRVREMPPTPDYPTGYWRLEKPMGNGGWQGIDPSTMKPGSQPETHVPFPGGG